MKKIDIGEVTLRDVRLSFADLFQPGKPMKSDDGAMQPGKYKANFLLPKVGHPATAANRAALLAASEAVKFEAWGKDSPKLKPNQVFLRDGDEENWEGYEGCVYVSANNKNKPVVVDRRKDADGKWVVLIGDEIPSRMYSGCWVNAVIRIWAQKSKTLPNGQSIPNRLNASVESVQFLRNGEAFSFKAIDPNEKFDDVPEEEEEVLI